ncbi:MAG TPA: glycosyltransferase [Lachnospiraceae bacterium]|nr:glycosyltransferase [Lachnospiraceae bacterium]
MKIILYEWEAYGEQGLHRGLESMGFNVSTYKRKIKNHLADNEFLTELTLMIVNNTMDAVISFNYFPLIAMACKAAKVKYLSWIFSEPHFSLYSDTVFFDSNYIFCFDHVQMEKLKAYGVTHAYHQSLAVDTELFEESIYNEKNKSTDEISFVGTLYTDERDYFSQIPFLPAYIKGYVEGICEAQMKVYGYNMLPDVLPRDILDQMKEYISFHMDAGYFLPFEQFIMDIINKKITIMERSRILKDLSENFHTTIYTGSDTGHLSKLSNGGYVHYYKQMPKIFHNSKINLNITLRSITSGIPLRVLDVLGCGGFLLTNYQPEIAEAFENGKELVMYESKEQLRELCYYYLSHEEERLEIAANGNKKVKEEFNYQKTLSKIARIIRGGCEA